MSNEPMDLSQAYDLLIVEGATIERDGDQFQLTMEGATIRVSFQEILDIAERHKKQSECEALAHEALQATQQLERVKLAEWNALSAKQAS